MGDPTSEPDLLLETLGQRPVGHERGKQHLDGDVILELQIACSVDRPHAAGTDDTENLVPFGKPLSSLQASVLDDGSLRRAAHPLDLSAQVADPMPQPLLPRPDLIDHAIEDARQAAERVVGRGNALEHRSIVRAGLHRRGRLGDTGYAV